MTRKHLASLLLGLASVCHSVGAFAAEHAVALFLSDSHAEQESFVRVINRSAVSGTVRIQAIDDSAWKPPPVTLSIQANETIHFNSGDLESGNVSKGLEGSIGSPTRGHWRLQLLSELDVEVLAYVRTRDGFLTGMVDTVAGDGTRYRVPVFNPGSNATQESHLRLANPGEAAVDVTVAGIDDRGRSSGTDVTFAIPAGSARTLTARQLEAGTSTGIDLAGALGDGHGKWQLVVDASRPIQLLSLLESPTGHITNLSTSRRRADAGSGAGSGRTHHVNVFPSNAHAQQQGFVRIINHSAQAGIVNIAARDDSERDYPPLTLRIAGNQAVHFNSGDLEDGNADKGLSGGTGAGDGTWRLGLSSDLDIEVLAYIRTGDGFLTSMHDAVPRSVQRHRVATFNPGSNTDQVSQLRLINLHGEPAAVTITGLDGAGESPGSEVRLTVPGGSARTLTAQELETGSAEGLTGALGSGSGKWQLIVASDRRIEVMSLLESPTGHLTNLSTRPEISALAPVSDRFERYNDLDPKPWWKASEPYNCKPAANTDSPWLEAGLPDLGGADTLSLIRYFGNGSYVRYSNMGFKGCTMMWKYPYDTHLDTPADPTYYSLGDIEIDLDIARVPADASGWIRDDGERIGMSMAETVALLNDHVAPFYRRISEGRLRIRFREGEEFEVTGDGSPQQLDDQYREVQGLVCDDFPCSEFDSGAANRMLFPDVSSAGAGNAWNGNVTLGLRRVRDADMEAVVHELGHAWLLWPHSYAEVMWLSDTSDPADVERNNPYSNRFDFMSQLGEQAFRGWRQTMPNTIAINRYAAGWIEPENVALHLGEPGTYTLRKPLDGGYQFLVVHSGRPYAFTTLEVLDDRDPAYVDDRPIVYDPSSPGGRRPLNYDGVYVNRYDQTVGTGPFVRSGPAFYNTENPDYLHDVGWGRDNHALIPDGGRRDLGGGVIASVSRNPDGSYDVSITGGRIAEFEPWCVRIWFAREYDTCCFLDYPR